MNRRVFLSLLPAIPLVPRLLGKDDPVEPWMILYGRYNELQIRGIKFSHRPQYIVFDDLDDSVVERIKSLPLR